MINLWFLFIAADVYRNWYIIEKKKSKPDYLQSFILRGMASIIHGVLMDVKVPADYWPILIFQVCSFWILFDFALNLLRGKDFDHIGQANWIDKYLGQIEPLYWALKMMAFAAGLVIWIIYG